MKCYTLKKIKYRFSLFIFILSCIFFNINLANAYENYYIDNQKTLLYKAINWWYDCLQTEQTYFCGKPIKYNRLGNINAVYDESGRVLSLQVKGGFADLLSILKSCDECSGPSHLKCVEQNRKYLGDGRAADVDDLNLFVFHGIEKKYALHLKEMEKHLLFVVEGRIAGLMSSGKIALHQGVTLLRKCAGILDDEDEEYSILVKIVNNETSEIIIRYHGIRQGYTH